MITIAESPDVVPFPAPAQTLEESGLTAGPHPAADAEVAALRRRADRHRPVAPARAGVPGHCSGARAPEGTASDCDRRRRLRRRRLVPLPDYRRRPHPRGAVPGNQSLRRRRPGAARAVPGVHERLPRGRPARRDPRARAAGVLAPRHQRRGARSARAGDQCRTLDVRLRPSGERQDGHLGGHSQPARRRDCDPARAGSRGQHRPALRSGES